MILISNFTTDSLCDVISGITVYETLPITALQYMELRPLLHYSIWNFAHYCITVYETSPITVYETSPITALQYMKLRPLLHYSIWNFIHYCITVYGTSSITALPYSAFFYRLVDVKIQMLPKQLHPSFIMADFLYSLSCVLYLLFILVVKG